MQAFESSSNSAVLRLPKHRQTSRQAKLGPLIGRQQDLQMLEHLLQSESRLLLLTGPSGVGKSRLLLELRSRVQDQFDACRYLDLRLEPDGFEVALEANHAGLLLLDHVTSNEIPEQLELLLHRQPQLRIVCASDKIWYSGIGYSGMQHVPVQALEMRSDSSETAPDEASQLFTLHAQRHDPHFTLGSNAPVIAVLCRKLDGLPRAIEMAAAQIAALSPSDMLKHTDALLRCPTPNASHCNLEQAIAASIAPLGKLEQMTLRALCLCQSAVGFERLQTLLGLNAQALAPALQDLHSRHLIRRSLEGDGCIQFQPLETVRLYLGLQAPDQTLLEAHAKYFCDHARQTLQPSPYLPDQQRALAQLQLERADLEQARAYWLTQANADPQAMQNFVDLSRIVAQHLSHQQATQPEAHEMLLGALSLEHLSSRQRVGLLEDAAAIAIQNEQYPQAETLLSEARSLALETNEFDLIVCTGHDLAYVYAQHMRQQEVEAILQDTLARQKHDHESSQYANTLSMLAWKRLDEHEFAQSIDLMQQARMIFENHHEPFATARALCGLACAHLRSGRSSLALGFLNEARRIQQESNGQDEADLLQVFGRCELEIGHWQTAWEHLEIALRSYHARQNHNRVFSTLTGLTEILIRSGRRVQAAQLFGHLEFIRCRFVPTPSGHGLAHYQNIQTQLAHLEPHEQTAWQQGSGWHDTLHALEQVKANLQDLLTHPEDSSMEISDQNKTISSAKVHLSKRQLEVMHLIREGHSNKRIAQLLDLSESTIKFHITEIFNRLGVRTRVQAIRAISKT